GPFDAGDPDEQSLTRARGPAGQEGEFDEVADAEPANLLPKLDIINAFSAAHFLNVFDLDGLPHVWSLRSGCRLVMAVPDRRGIHADQDKKDRPLCTLDVRLLRREGWGRARHPPAGRICRRRSAHQFVGGVKPGRAYTSLG